MINRSRPFSSNNSGLNWLQGCLPDSRNRIRAISTSPAITRQVVHMSPRLPQGPVKGPTSKKANFRLLFGVLSSRRRHLKPNHLSLPSQSQHLANSHQPRRSDTSINSCTLLYNPAPFPNKAELSGELLLCVAPFLSLVPKPGRRDTPTGPRLPPDTSSSLPSSSFSGAGSSHSPLLSGL